MKISYQNKFLIIVWQCQTITENDKTLNHQFFYLLSVGNRNLISKEILIWIHTLWIHTLIFILFYYYCQLR